MKFLARLAGLLLMIALMVGCPAENDGTPAEGEPAGTEAEEGHDHAHEDGADHAHEDGHDHADEAQ